MVKDLLREIKRKAFQFLALTLITMLGVGFFVGIQVTGYDMRMTGDQYMESRDVLDYKVMHTLGIDDEFVEDVHKLVGGTVTGVYEEDMFARKGEFDSVVRIYEYTDATKNDLTLLDGRMPEKTNEAVIDSKLIEYHDFKIGDTFRLYKNVIFDNTEVEIVGIVESSLYMNLERGQSRLGVGNVSGFMYAYDIPHVDKDSVYTGIRIKDPISEDVKTELVQNDDELIEARFQRIIQPELDKLEDAKDTLNENKIKAEREFDKTDKELKEAKTKLDDSLVELQLGLNELAQTELSGSLVERQQTAKANFDEKVQETRFALDALKQQIAATENPEEAAILEAVLHEKEAELQQGIDVFNAGYQEINQGIEEYQRGFDRWEQGKNTYYSQKERVERELTDAENEIIEAYQKIAEADRGTLIVQTREDVVIGYREFYDDSNRIEGIGKVFPIIFFCVSILVTLSTVSRMVDENRMEIGVYKALGYSTLRTSMKYILFAGLSWLIGSILGLYFGFYFIPRIIYDAYRIMYLTPELVDDIVLSYAWIPLVISFLSSVGIAIFKTFSVAKEKTASLLRPVSPKGGQRILLERIPFIWNQFSFLLKVSFRNLFRNKTRFLMTILGIGGTTGLLIVGFGIQHSIYSIVDKQFDEIIQYDGLAYYEELDFDTNDFSDYTITFVENGKADTNDVTLYAAEDLNHLGSFISLKDRKSKEPIKYGADDVIITEKLARLLNVKEGDSANVIIDDRKVTFVIDGIAENYAGHYIYTSQSKYEQLIGKNVESNMILFKVDDIDHDVLAQKLLDSDHILSVQFLNDISSTYRDMMKNFDVVIWVVVVSALALEVLVLSNLITMNMSERKKELATLKVLGFNKNELAAYVLRENIILTVLASLFGFVFGKYLHYFVITKAEIDAVMFNYELLWTSYFAAFALTFALSVILNFALSQRANRVNMSEALKTFDA